MGRPPPAGDHAIPDKGQLSVGIRREGDEAMLSVGDTGSGIADNIRSKIFDAFFTTRRTGEGSGLGLYLVKKIAEKHGGRVEIQTEVGVGTTVTVYLRSG